MAKLWQDRSFIYLFILKIKPNNNNYVQQYNKIPQFPFPWRSIISNSRESQPGTLLLLLVFVLKISVLRPGTGSWPRLEGFLEGGCCSEQPSMPACISTCPLTCEIWRRSWSPFPRPGLRSSKLRTFSLTPFHFTHRHVSSPRSALQVE